MNNFIIRLVIRSLTFFLVLFSASNLSAQKNLQIYSIGDSSLNLNKTKFFEQLESKLKDSTVGYGILVTRNQDKIYQNTGGYRITPADDEAGMGIPFDMDTRMHIASITKTITAIALIKLLNEKGVSIMEPFKNYLPSFWKIHTTFEEMPIRNLMYMKSGINAENDALTSSYDSLQTIVADGVNLSDTANFVYSNANYGLLRIVIAYLSGYKESPLIENYDRNETRINNTYLKYLNEALFTPAGIFNVTCHSTESNPTLMYPFPYNNEYGILTSKGELYKNGDNLTNYVGGLGLHLSINEVSQFVRSLIISQKILDKSNLNDLVQHIFPFARREKTYFSYSYAMGLWIEGTETLDYYGGANACVFALPDQIIVTIFVNSWNQNHPLLNKIILDSYENSLLGK